MIWTPQRNIEQGQLVARMYERAGAVPCERQAVLIGGLPGADKLAVLAQAGVDPARYLTVSVDAVLREMAARGLIPHVQGLSPMEAADLAHAEAQFLVKRLALRAVADGRDLLFDISFAALHAVESWLDALKLAGYSTQGIVAEITIEESVRRSAAEHRRGHDEYRQGRGYSGRYIPPEAIRALAGAAESPETRATPARSAASHIEPADDPSDDIAGMLTSYRTGQLTLNDLACTFRARRWPPVPRACPPGLEAAASAIDDPEPYVPGSFDDIVRAYDLGHINDTDYEALARAAAR